MAGAHRIGILTSGGDAPGMNPAIRAIVRTAGAEGITCIGIRRGYAGLINGDVFELTGNDVDGIARRGGTILYTARSEEFRTEAGVDKAAKVCKYLGIDGLITIGGDGTYRGALELARRGVRVVGIPATIDNDMGCTEYTIGFDTACNTAIEAIDKLRDTGQSHERVSVVEVMGRNAGHLALYTALAAGASAVLLPEKEVDLEHDVIDVIRDIQYHCTGRISCTCYRETPVKNFKEVKNKFYIRMLVDNKPGVLAAIASVFGVHKVSIARVIQKTKENDAAELVIVTEAVKEKHLEDALAHLVDMDTTREIGTVIREY